MRKIIITCMAILLLAGNTAFGQQNASSGKVKVFLDCSMGWLCDFDFVRTEMKMVDFVRDRFQSDVHLQVNTQFSNSGGEQQQMLFLGMQRFRHMNDTLVYFNDPGSTEDDKRKQLVHYMKLGLTRYIARTGTAKAINISYTVDTTNAASEANAPKKDPWNSWVFQLGGSTFFNGSANYRSSSFYAYVNAVKETEKWKVSLSASLDRSTNVFKDDNGESKFLQKSYEVEGSVARSINNHWSVGLESEYENTLFGNIRYGLQFMPRIEYSLFPYEKFNSQRIVLQYHVGVLYNRYYDTTVYFKTSEFQARQAIELITSFNKPWGNINVGVFWSNYFEDFSKNSLSFNGAVNWKITKGLNFGIYGYYALINDQIALRKGNATRDDLLLRNRELLSSFEYNLGFGFSYRFGSISNSVVNPRFKGLSYSVSF